MLDDACNILQSGVIDTSVRFWPKGACSLGHSFCLAIPCLFTFFLLIVMTLGSVETLPIFRARPCLRTRLSCSPSHSKCCRPWENNYETSMQHGLLFMLNQEHSNAEFPVKLESLTKKWQVSLSFPTFSITVFPACSNMRITVVSIHLCLLSL